MKIDLRPIRTEIKNHVWLRTDDDYHNYAPYIKKYRMVGEKVCFHCGCLNSENNINYSLLNYCRQIVQPTK